jgi:hypothetical protein
LVTSIEVGKKTDPRLSSLLALARALEVEIGQLAVGGEPPAAKKKRNRLKPRQRKQE